MAPSQSDIHQSSALEHVVAIHSGMTSERSGLVNGGILPKSPVRCLGHKSLPPPDLGRVDEEKASPGGRPLQSKQKVRRSQIRRIE
ncbi:hypothetical protein TNCV_4192751 [Trichonephila clavipes]|nr:hypothetical protein TNCV_4192751 [Trichonephila clavipes]